MAEVRIVVRAGAHPRRMCPVFVEIPVPESASGRRVVLLTAKGEEWEGQGSGAPAGCASGIGCSESAIGFIVPKLEAQEELPLTLQWRDDPARDRVQVADDGKSAVRLAVDGKLLTSYRYLGDPARPCFFPLMGPDETPVTRSWPVEDGVPGEPHDHPHHRSFWVAHGDVNGTDNWSEAEGHAFQLHQGIVEACGGPVFGRIAAKTDWTDAGRRKLLEEQRTLTAYAVSEDFCLLDLEVVFTATERDVRFGDTKEGGILAMRVAPAMDGDHGGRIENSYGGIGEGECWGKRAQWCDYSGEIEGRLLGIAIFDHPSSFRHPTFWHVRDYGMYTANPFGWHDFSADASVDGSHLLPRGASLSFRYRIYLHRGSAAEAAVAARYHDYANPPTAEVVG